jgi:hypothetical protein
LDTKHTTKIVSAVILLLALAMMGVGYAVPSHGETPVVAVRQLHESRIIGEPCETQVEMRKLRPKPVISAPRVAKAVQVPKKHKAPTQTTPHAARKASYTGSIPTLIRKLVAAAGFKSCCQESMVKLCKKESGFRPTAMNPSGKYHGLFQLSESIVGGNDGDPCGAWTHSQSTGWY